MIDTYSKVVLTVIALALIGILTRTMPRAEAFNNCGQAAQSPCFIVPLNCQQVPNTYGRC
jgi:hypothetical protein